MSGLRLGGRYGISATGDIAGAGAASAGAGAGRSRAVKFQARETIWFVITVIPAINPMNSKKET